MCGARSLHACGRGSIVVYVRCIHAGEVEQAVELCLCQLCWSRPYQPESGRGAATQRLALHIWWVKWSTGPVVQLAPLGLGRAPLGLLEYFYFALSQSRQAPHAGGTVGRATLLLSSISRLSGLVCKERQYAQGGWLAARDRYERFGVEAAERWSTPGPHGRCGGWGTLATGPHYKFSSCVCRSSTDTDVSHTICSS